MSVEDFKRATALSFPPNHPIFKRYENSLIRTANRTLQRDNLLNWNGQTYSTTNCQLATLTSIYETGKADTDFQPIADEQLCEADINTVGAHIVIDDEYGKPFASALQLNESGYVASLCPNSQATFEKYKHLLLRKDDFEPIIFDSHYQNEILQAINNRSDCSQVHDDLSNLIISLQPFRGIDIGVDLLKDSKRIKQLIFKMLFENPRIRSKIYFDGDDERHFLVIILYNRDLTENHMMRCFIKGSNKAINVLMFSDWQNSYDGAESPVAANNIYDAIGDKDKISDGIFGVCLLLLSTKHRHRNQKLLPLTEDALYQSCDNVNLFLINQYFIQIRGISNFIQFFTLRDKERAINKIKSELLDHLHETILSNRITQIIVDQNYLQPAIMNELIKQAIAKHGPRKKTFLYDGWHCPNVKNDIYALGLQQNKIYEEQLFSDQQVVALLSPFTDSISPSVRLAFIACSMSPITVTKFLGAEIVTASPRSISADQLPPACFDPQQSAKGSFGAGISLPPVENLKVSNSFLYNFGVSNFTILGKSLNNKQGPMCSFNFTVEAVRKYAVLKTSLRLQLFKTLQYNALNGNFIEAKYQQTLEYLAKSVDMNDLRRQVQQIYAVLNIDIQSIPDESEEMKESQDEMKDEQSENEQNENKQVKIHSVPPC